MLGGVIRLSEKCPAALPAPLREGANIPSKDIERRYPFNLLKEKPMRIRCRTTTTIEIRVREEEVSISRTYFNPGVREDVPTPPRLLRERAKPDDNH